MHKVFVYGSLKKGFHNHRLLEKSTFVGTSELPGYRMVSLGGFPGIMPTTEELPPIKGEVYEVDQPTMVALDRLEGHPHFYMRFLIDTELGSAWVYTLSEQEYGHRAAVPTGEWGHERVA